MRENIKARALRPKMLILRQENYNLYTEKINFDVRIRTWSNPFSSLFHALDKDAGNRGQGAISEH